MIYLVLMMDHCIVDTSRETNFSDRYASQRYNIIATADGSGLAPVHTHAMGTLRPPTVNEER